MKFIKLSLVSALAVSSAFAGGDITPVEPVVEVPAVVIAEDCNNNTTISGKLQAYYYTDDTVDLFDEESSSLGTAVTLDVTHKFTNNIAMNFSAVGYVNLMDDGTSVFFGPYMEEEESGAFINVANITATFAGTTVILGRQLLDTPMLGGFDWLLAPGAFEAYTVANSSIENLTLVGSYVRTWRPNNTGDNFVDLTDINDGNNWTVGAAYDNKTISGSVWYYNVDAGDYTQVYADAGYNFDVVQLAGQYVYTDYNADETSTVFGAKASGTFGGFSLMAAYNNVADNITGFVGRDTLYTSSWNTFTSNVMGDSFKVEASGEFGGLTAAVSYAYYEYEQNAIAGLEDDGSEIDVVLGYAFTKCISVDAIYSNTDYGEGDDANALEFIATYKF